MPGGSTRLLLTRFAALISVVLASSALFGGLIWMAPGGAEQLDPGGGFCAWLLSFWKGALSGDLGRSYRGYPVATMVIKGAARSLPIIALALSLSIASGLVVVLAFEDRLQLLGKALRTLIHALSLTPVFLLGYLALVLLAVPPEGGFQTLAAVAILALGDGMLTDVLLDIDAEVAALRRKDFIQSARLRGTPLWRQYVPHLSLPLARLAASKVAYLVGGVLVLERVLGIQGIGLMGYQAAKHGDFPLLVAITVFVTALVTSMSTLVDLLRLAVDPRTRRQRGPGVGAKP